MSRPYNERVDGGVKLLAFLNEQFSILLDACSLSVRSVASFPLFDESIFKMRKLRFYFFAACLTLATSLTFSFASAQNLDADGALPRATPESVGVASDAVIETIQALDAKFNRVDAVMILRDGKVIAEAWRAPNAPDKPHALYSLSKSFCSTAVGFGVAEGILSLDEKMVDVFADEVPENPDPRVKDVTLEHLLSMSSGQASDPWEPEMLGTDYGLPQNVFEKKPTWATKFMERKIEYEPGTTFVYNTTGTYMAGAMLQKKVGTDLVAYLKPRLFDPLHIETPYWEQSPQGYSKGGTGLFLKTEDIAKFGQLYLQKGKWNGEQLLPEGWVENATAKHVSNGTDPNSDWAQGYGFQFWRCRHNVYRGDGMYSQFCVVMPDQNAVVAINSDCNDYQGIINVLFDKLLPAMNGTEPLPENAEKVAKLREVEKSLQPKEGGSGSSVFALTINSKALKREVKYRVYVPNEYKTTSIYYPTLYLLHGLYGSEADWSSKEQGNMQEICDAYFAKNPAQKRIVIMPDGGNLWYRDSADDSCKYETFFFEELMPEVQKRFRCLTDRANTAIAGLSMGGYGSALYALRHPDRFESCYAMSPAIFSRETVKDFFDFKTFKNFLAGRENFQEGDERFDEYYEANDHFALIEKFQGDVEKPRILLDCGDDDGLLHDDFTFYRKARSLKYPCEMRVRNGGHTWEYWREALPLALEFIAQKENSK